MVSSLELPLVLIDRMVGLALEEDLASGDVTTEACIDPSAQAVAHAVARQSLVACGGPVPGVAVTSTVIDGSRASAGERLWTVRGRARSLLMAERVALNFVSRMSGIATQTRAFVDAVPAETKLRIADTRKTTPGLRAFERYAVRAGGGRNHRDDLGAAVLIKDNHIVACGGIRPAIERARAHAPHTSKIECEVDTLDQLDEALAARADVILLDNMEIALIVEAVRRTAGRAVLEASGHVTLDRIADLARAGVDAVSIGSLTHSVRVADIGLDFEP